MLAPATVVTSSVARAAATAARCDVHVVGGKDERRALLGIEPQQQVDDPAPKEAP
ncbi:hypothetical protein [Streptomyces sp. A0958]|uniref:hypothetical protein n=1 Tax=Streptomyces sp. A0958 TaxID=2563101 RepID=UPI001448A15F|nr:hypothetical protein [Streptomyces sp. A0958]